LKLAKQFVSDEDILNAKIEAEKSTTQKILDNIQARKDELEQEKLLIQERLNEKQTELETQKALYENLTQTKIDLEKQYYDFFKEKIQEQQLEIKQSIKLLEKLNAL
jgi:hypothetical protein